MKIKIPALGILLSVCLISSACSGGDESTPTAAAPSTSAPRAEIPSATSTPSAPAAMAVYVDPNNNFTIKYPKDWALAGDEVFATDTDAFIGKTESLTTAGIPSGTVERYAATLRSVYETNLKAKVLSQTNGVTPGGLPSVLMTYTSEDGNEKATVLTVVANGYAFNATYYSISLDGFDRLKPIIDYSFSTLRTLKPGNEFDEASSYIEWGEIFVQRKDTEKAIYAFGKAIALDPKNADAYSNRSIAYLFSGDEVKALEDANIAIKLAPKDPESFKSISLIYWFQGKNQDAVSALTKALELKKNDDESLNQRGLVYTTMGNYQAAINDTTRVIDMKTQQEFPAQDTRAYAYLKMGDLQKAKADYDHLISVGFNAPYSFLGAGIVYSKLGDAAKAKELIRQGLETAAIVPAAWQDPQLKDLIKMAKETH